MSVTLREKSLSSGKKSLYLDIYIEGKRWTEFLKLYVSKGRPTHNDKETKALAKVLARERERELAAQNVPAAQAYLNAKRRIDFLNAFRAFGETKVTRDFNSIYKYMLAFAGKKIDLKRLIPDAPLDAQKQVNIAKLKLDLLLPYQKPLDLKHITPEWINSFQSFMKGRVQHNTIVRYTQLISSFFNHAIRQGWTFVNPVAQIPLDKKLKLKQIKRDFLTEHEVKLLLSNRGHINRQAEQLFFMLCFTGLRWSDMHRLCFRQIKLIVHDNRPNDYFFEFTHKKTERLQTLPVVGNGVKILEEIIRERQGLTGDQPVTALPSGPLFPDYFMPGQTNAKSERAYARFQYALKKWKDVVEIPALTSHMGRRSFATMCLSVGIDIRIVQELLGHQRITTTMIYTQVHPTMQQAALLKLPDLAA